MTEATAETSSSTHAIDSSFMMKVFCAFAVLALLSLGISIGGKWLGRSLSLAGHSEDRTQHEIVIGNNVISADANMIRFGGQRHDGAANRLDLYLRWPQLDGYSAAARDDFNNTKGGSNIVFLSFEPQMMSRDMSGRLEPIYRPMLVSPGQPGPGGTQVYEFSEDSGYLNERLVTAYGKQGTVFAARCLNDGAELSLAPCERDIHLGDGLSLTYRFPRELLADWETLDEAIRMKAASMLRTGI